MDSPHLIDAEWNFKDCPENELHFCLHYELAREIKLWREIMLRRRGGNLLKSTGKYEVGIFAKGSSGIMPPYEFTLRYPHLAPMDGVKKWPKIPWLALDAELRKQIVGKSREINPWALTCDPWPLMTKSGPQPNITLTQDGREITYSVFKIDWGKSNAQLRREFEAWLQYWRALTQAKPIEKRGRTSPRDLLKKLGAYRLLKEMPWDKASDLTAEILSKGEPLYSEQSAWLRAEREAKIAIKTFEREKRLGNVLAAD